MSRNSVRVLVVDDHRDTADMLAITVTLWGYDAEACYGGVAALAVARTYRPHVVLLDPDMPDANGFEVARGLRKLPGLGNTLIIGVTGLASESSQHSARAAGFDLCLVKPVAAERLRELVRRTVPWTDQWLAASRPPGVLTSDGGQTRRAWFAT